MTSNLGASEMSRLQSGGIGFVPQSASGSAEDLDRKIYRVALEAAKRKFSPEFMNRIDKVIVFGTLNTEQLRQILRIELQDVQRRILASQPERPFLFECTPQAVEFLMKKGTDRRYGARHLKRAIEQYLVAPVSSLISTDQIEAGETVQVDAAPEADALIFLKQEAPPPMAPAHDAAAPGDPASSLAGVGCCFRSAVG